MQISFFSKTLEIKKDGLISIDIFNPPVIRTTFWPLKIDLADLNEFVGIKGTTGFFKRIEGYTAKSDCVGRQSKGIIQSEWLMVRDSY